MQGSRDSGSYPRLLGDALGKATHNDGTVDNGVGIGHHHDASKSSSSSSSGASFQSLFVLTARRAPVRVNIDKSWEEMQSIRIDMANSIEIRADFSDVTLGETDVHNAIQADRGVKDMGVTDNHLAPTRL